MGDAGEGTTRGGRERGDIGLGAEGGVEIGVGGDERVGGWKG